jgi:hypothetical protein
MSCKCHTQIIQASLQPPTEAITISPQTIALIEKEGQRKSSDTQELSPEDIESAQILQKLRLIAFEYETYEGSIYHISEKRPPCF